MSHSDRTRHVACVTLLLRRVGTDKLPDFVVEEAFPEQRNLNLLLSCMM